MKSTKTKRFPVFGLGFKLGTFRLNVTRLVLEVKMNKVVSVTSNTKEKDSLLRRVMSLDEFHRKCVFWNSKALRAAFIEGSTGQFYSC